MINSILQEDLQADHPPEDVEEEPEKPTVTFWLIGSHGQFTFCTEDCAKKHIIDHPDSMLICASSLKDVVTQIDAANGISDSRLTKITRCGGDPVIGTQVEPYLLGKHTSEERFAAVIQEYWDFRNKGHDHYGYKLRIEGYEDTYLTKDISLVELMGLMEDYGKKITISSKLCPNLGKELADLMSMASPSDSRYLPDKEVVRDQYKFSYSYHGMFEVNFLSKKALASRSAAANKKRTREKLEAAKRAADRVHYTLDEMFKKVLQSMLPDWATPSVSGIYDRYKLLRKLKKFNKLRKSPEYKALFTGSELTEEDIKLVLAEPGRLCHGTRLRRDKIRRFVVAEVRRLRK